MEFKNYFKKELILTDKQLELAYKLYSEKRLPPKLPDFAPMTECSITYQFSTLGVVKLMRIGEEKFILNEDEIDNP